MLEPATDQVARRTSTLARIRPGRAENELWAVFHQQVVVTETGTELMSHYPFDDGLLG